MLRRISTYLLFSILTYFLLTIWANRATLKISFDPIYWQDKYEHSQWKLPLSLRTLGDDGLYLYEGYRLSRGDDPTTLNAEVPPLGKYLIGFTLKLFSKPAIYGYIITTLAVIIWTLFVRQITKSLIITLTFGLLFITDPLLTRQFTLTMLDSLHLLTLGCYFLALTIRSPGINSIFTGAALGLFSQTKAPILSPLLFILALYLIWSNTKNYRYLLIFTCSSLAFFLLPYLRYFLLDHNLFDWFKVQKWVINFYTGSQLAPNIGSIWTTLITDNYQSLSSHKFIPSSEWSLSWPLITLSTFIAFFLFTRDKLSYPKKHTKLILVLAYFLILTSLLYTFIPFWTRYLLLLLPIFYIFALYILTKLPQLIRLMIVATLIFFNLLASKQILFPTPETYVKQIIYDLQNGHFQDIYEHLSADSKSTITQSDFHRLGLTLFNQAEIESVAIDIHSYAWRHNSPQLIPLQITYYTRHLGPFSENINLPLVNEHNLWHISWDWNLLMSGLDKNKQLITQVDLAKRGSIIATDNTPSASDVPGFLVWVTPNKIEKQQEDSLLKKLENLFNQKVKAIAIHERLVGNSLGDQPIALGVIPTPQIIDLQGYAAVTLTPAYFRQYQENNLFYVGEVANAQFFECCSRLYNTTTYSGTSGLELEKNSLLKGENGGSLKIIDSSGNVIRTIIEEQKRDGTNLQL